MIKTISVVVGADVHAKFKDKVHINDLTMQDVLTQFVLDFSETTKYDKNFGISEKKF